MQKTEYPGIGETLYSARLSNGLELRVVPKPGFRTRYAVLAANYGGAHRRFSLEGVSHDTPAGVAHYLEHKMFDLPDGDNALNILTANGADPNAFTSSGMTAYYFQCTEDFEENLRLLLHFVTTPYFTPETVQKEQGIIAQEIRMGEDSPGNAVFYNLLSQLYQEHPVKDKVAGTVQSIGEITAETLYACHKAFYAPSNLCLCVEGDVDPERVLEIAEKELSPEYREAPKAELPPEENPEPLERLHRQRMEVAAPIFIIGAKVLPEKEGPAFLRQQLVSQLCLRLLVGCSSPFYTRLYAQGLLNRDFDYEIYFTADTGTLLIEGESSDPEAVLKALEEEIARVAAEGFDPARFQRAKRASLGARLRGLEDFDNVCVALASGVFDGFNALDSLPLLESVTKGECEDFLRACLRPERLALSIVEPKGAEPC